MKPIKNLMERVDSFQQQHASLAFPVAVIKRFGDDKAGKQAALVTYYAFLSLFPLLLIFLTIMSIIASHSPELRDQIIQRVLEYFPALGDSLQDNVQTSKSHGIALALESLILLYGARGLANILQETFNNLWHIEKEERPGFLGDNLRSFGMMAAVGIGMVVGAGLSYVLGSVLDVGFIGALLVTGLNLAVTFGLFLAVFRLGTSSAISLNKLVLGAIVASFGTLLVQHFGGYIMARQLPHLTDSYGTFAIPLGMMFWIYLQAQIILYAIEITIVRAENDWPKKFF